MFSPQTLTFLISFCPGRLVLSHTTIYSCACPQQRNSPHTDNSDFVNGCLRQRVNKTAQNSWNHRIVWVGVRGIFKPLALHRTATLCLSIVPMLPELLVLFPLPWESCSRVWAPSGWGIFPWCPTPDSALGPSLGSYHCSGKRRDHTCPSSSSLRGVLTVLRGKGSQLIHNLNISLWIIIKYNKMEKKIPVFPLVVWPVPPRSQTQNLGAPSLLGGQCTHFCQNSCAAFLFRKYLYSSSNLGSQEQDLGDPKRWKTC